MKVDYTMLGLSAANPGLLPLAFESSGGVWGPIKKRSITSKVIAGIFLLIPVSVATFFFPQLMAALFAGLTTLILLCWCSWVVTEDMDGIGWPSFLMLLGFAIGVISGIAVFIGVANVLGME